MQKPFHFALTIVFPGEIAALDEPGAFALLLTLAVAQLIEPFEQVPAPIGIGGAKILSVERGYSSGARGDSFRFEVGVVFELHHFTGAPFKKRPTDECDPLGRLIVVAIIVLMLDAAGLQRQEQ